ncbi:MAG: hypothetical protein GY786_09515 [Proteobacteria bacterium]|nr:hypothetical protein [Pseudomonadota bacterium]
MNNVSFADIAIVSCGTLSLELNYLKKEGFLDTSHLFFTTPGLHEDIHELKAQLIQRINKAKEKKDISHYNFIVNSADCGTINPALHSPRTHYSHIPTFQFLSSLLSFGWSHRRLC